MSLGFSRVKPNKPNLDELEEEFEFSDECKELLEMKKQQIENKFKKYELELTKLGKRARRKLFDAFKELNEIYMNIGKRRMAVLANMYQNYFEVDVRITFVSYLGINVPKIRYDLKKKGKYTPGSYYETPLAFDDLIENLRAAFSAILKLAETNYVVIQYMTIFNQVNRRINALEEIILPELEGNISKITEILEENDREELIKIRHVKKMYEEK